MSADTAELKISHHELFEVWCNEPNSDKKSKNVYMYIIQKLSLEDHNDNFLLNIKKRSKNFSSRVKSRWSKVCRNKKAFLKMNEAWLKEYFAVNLEKEELLPSTSTHEKNVGRPKKDFIESSVKTKRRRVKPFVEHLTSDELSFATRTSFHSEGRRDAAEMLSEIVSSPMRATKVKKAYKGGRDKIPRKVCPERALAMFVDSKLTKKQYMALRLTSKDHNADIFPTYKILLAAKTQCYPNDISVTEKSAEIKLQSLVDHTVQRLFSVQMDVLKQCLVDLDTSSIQVIFKWGCDGSSGHSRYNQKWTEMMADDSYMFSMSIVPIRILALKKDKSEIILWQNPRTSSTRYCRPIKIMFEKEETKLTSAQVADVNRQISKLLPTKLILFGYEFEIKSKLILTMIDGKICNALSENSAASVCYICGAKPSEMNKLDLVKKKDVRENYLSFGISPLHAWIRSLECQLNISYRLEIKKWQVQRGDKDIVEQRKRMIQGKLKEKLGLLVDIPKPGSGTTNNGNTARIFFNNPEIVSEITGLNKELIQRLGVILKTISCGFKINETAFEDYTRKTAELYLMHYSWYYMPVTVHKILIHGPTLIKAAILPIGMLSEEAQEARNKDLRNYREHHARKFSRMKNMEDILHLLLISSDPLISSLRELPKRVKGSFAKEVLALLEENPIPTEPTEATNSENDEDNNYSDEEDDDDDENSDSDEEDDENSDSEEEDDENSDSDEEP